MQALYQRLANTSLPIMHETADTLRSLVDRRTTRHQDLERVLLSDPAAVVAVFRQLEQTRPGSFEQVADAAHAVSLMGTEPFRRLLGSLSQVEAPGPAASPGGSIVSALSQAAHAALYAETLAASKGFADDRAIPTAALLQNPILLGLWAVDPAAAQRVSAAVTAGATTDRALSEELGEPARAVNQHLATTWALPSLARRAIGPDAKGGDGRLEITRLGDAVAQATAGGWDHPMIAPITEQLSAFLDLNEDDATSWLHRQATDAARQLSHLGYSLPGYNLILLPGDLAPEPEPEPTGEPADPAPADPPPPAAAPDLQATMAAIMRRIRDDTGSSRVVFAILNPERSHLRTRLVLGAASDDPLRRLNLDLREKTLFTGLMAQSQSVWLNRDNARKYAPLLPPALRRLIGPQGAFLMSLFVNGRPLGLMYADGDRPDEPGYRQFRDLCGEATAALAGDRRVP